MLFKSGWPISISGVDCFRYKKIVHGGGHHFMGWSLNCLKMKKVNMKLGGCCKGRVWKKVGNWGGYDVNTLYSYMTLPKKISFTWNTYHTKLNLTIYSNCKHGRAITIWYGIIKQLTNVFSIVFPLQICMYSSHFELCIIKS